MIHFDYYDYLILPIIYRSKFIMLVCEASHMLNRSCFKYTFLVLFCPSRYSNMCHMYAINVGSVAIISVARLSYFAD